MRSEEDSSPEDAGEGDSTFQTCNGPSVPFESEEDLVPHRSPLKMEDLAQQPKKVEFQQKALPLIMWNA